MKHDGNTINVLFLNICKQCYEGVTVDLFRESNMVMLQRTEM